MKLLLDTHIFIWLAGAPSKLSLHERALCEDRASELVLSVASSREMQIKLQLGKLQVARPAQDLVANQQRTNGVRVLPVILDQVLTLRDLPAQHSDRFDRLRIARATVEKAAILSRDRVFTKYPVTVLT